MKTAHSLSRDAPNKQLPIIITGRERNVNMIEIENSRETFKRLAKDMIPVIKDMERVLRENGVNRIANLSVETNGYFTFSHNGTDWDFTRLRSDCKPKIRKEYEEEIEWEG